MSGILNQYIDLQLVNDRKRTEDIQKRVAGMDRAALDAHFAGNREVGNVLLVEDRTGGDTVILEWIVSPKSGDSIAILYKPHPLFNTHGDYQRRRAELITALNDIADAGSDGVAIVDPVRRRVTHLTELGFMQLLDVARSKVTEFNKKTSR